MGFKRGFGWVRDYPDFRDQKFAYKAKVDVPLPPAVFNIVPDVRDQGELGACVFFMVNTLMGSVIAANDMPDESWRILSPLYGYYKYREALGDVSYDSGASIRDAFKVVKDYGICREGLWPYNLEMWDVAPCQEAETDARNRQLISYHVLETLDDMLSCLAEGFCFGCGISVYDSFMDVGTSGKVPMPSRNEHWLGGHALTIWGYHKADGMFYGQNSWGQSWGKAGRFTIPFEFLTDKGLASDFWTIRLIEG